MRTLNTGKFCFLLALLLCALHAEDKPNMAELLAKAETGDAQAQWQLGVAYSEGKEVTKDAGGLASKYRYPLPWNPMRSAGENGIKFF